MRIKHNDAHHHQHTIYIEHRGIAHIGINIFSLCFNEHLPRLMDFISDENKSFLWIANTIKQCEMANCSVFSSFAKHIIFSPPSIKTRRTHHQKTNWLSAFSCLKPARIQTQHKQSQRIIQHPNVITIISVDLCVSWQGFCCYLFCMCNCVVCSTHIVQFT